jgi:hypothetical protein
MVHNIDLFCGFFKSNFEKNPTFFTKKTIFPLKAPDSLDKDSKKWYLIPETRIHKKGDLMKLRDYFWIWGHHPGAHHTGEAGKLFKVPGENRMGPREGAAYLGIPNCCRVVFNGIPKPPFDEETARLQNFRKLVWSVLGDVSSKRNDDAGDDLAEVLRQAELFPNVTGAVLDDFFRPGTRDARLTVHELRTMASQLRNAPRPLTLWLVYYAALFEIDYSDYLEAVDGITFWSWTSEELARAEENINRLIAMTPGKEHYAGCYLYNYGESLPMTVEEMAFQTELYYTFLREKKIDGIIVCSNNIVDTGLEAVEYLRQWLQNHGDEDI